MTLLYRGHPPLRPATLQSLGQPSPVGHIDIGLVGDVLLRMDGETAVPRRVIDEVRQTAWQPLAGCGLIIANLEAPITAQESPLERKPHIHRMSADALAIFDDRFVLSLANNHTMDFGPAGLLDTMAALEESGIAYAGAGPTLERASQPRLIGAEGTTIGVICAADPRFSPATPTSPGTFPAHADLLVDSIRSVAGSAQVIVVSLHMGLEHVSVPSVTQIRLAEACLAAGAHVVHFHHSHRSSGAATGGRGVALFGTGNYVFTKAPKVKIPSSRHTAAWRVRIDKATHQVVAVEVAPAILNDTGLPRRLDGEQARRELEQLQRCSDRMLNGFLRHWSRLRDLLSPGFLRANFYNYGFLLRSRGPRYVVRSLLGGIRAQLGRPKT